MSNIIKDKILEKSISQLDLEQIADLIVGGQITLDKMYEFTKQMNEKTKNLTVFLMTLETACENIDIKSINSMVASYQKFLSLNEEILSIVNKTTLKDDADILNG